MIIFITHTNSSYRLSSQIHHYLFVGKFLTNYSKNIFAKMIRWQPDREFSNTVTKACISEEIGKKRLSLEHIERA